MTACTYLAPLPARSDDRIALLRRQDIEVTVIAHVDDVPAVDMPIVLDGIGADAAWLDATLSQLSKTGRRTLVLFRLERGASFRDRRAALIALGARDAMEAEAPVSDLPLRLRALLREDRKPFVLVIEDNPKTGPWAVNVLSAQSIDATCVTTIAEARELFETRTVDALVVDRELPDGDGLEFIAFLRRNGLRTPALLFTAMDGIADRIMGLRDAGADDYICKPVHADELAARVQVLLRPREKDETLNFGPLELGRRDRIARWRGERIGLRPKECDMLIYLAERDGLPIPKRMIYADVWDKVFMDIGSNPVAAARHRLVRDLKAFLKTRGEEYPEFLVTESESYRFISEPLLKLPSTGPAG